MKWRGKYTKHGTEKAHEARRDEAGRQLVIEHEARRKGHTIAIRPSLHYGRKCMDHFSIGE